MRTSKPIQTQTKAERRRLELAETHLAMAINEIRRMEGLAERFGGDGRFGGTRILAEMSAENWRRRRIFWAKQVARLSGRP